MASRTHPQTPRPNRLRRIGLPVVAVGALGLVPWIGYLAATLPATYRAHNWNLAWVGFDVVLLLLLAATAVLGHRRHRMVTVTAFATGVLLLCDAWFDATTSGGSDQRWALLTALLIELPLASFLLISSLRTIALLSSAQPAAAVAHAESSAKGFGTASNRSLV